MTHKSKRVYNAIGSRICSLVIALGLLIAVGVALSPTWTWTQVGSRCVRLCGVRRVAPLWSRPHVGARVDFEIMCWNLLYVLAPTCTVALLSVLWKKDQRAEQQWRIRWAQSSDESRFTLLRSSAPSDNAAKTLTRAWVNGSQGGSSILVRPVQITVGDGDDR